MESWEVRGKTCMITGASSGIGRATALELASRGAELVLVCRDLERGEQTVHEIAEATGNRNLQLLLCDLSSQEEIRKGARDYLANDRPLDVLINNAGVVHTTRTETVDGIESTFAVNHLAYFMLTLLLLRRIQESAPARIINVSSDVHRSGGGRFDFDDVFARKRFSAMRSYGQSKLANVLFTRELARRLEGTGVTVNAVHPGGVATRLGLNNGWRARLAVRLFGLFARSPARGAETSVYLACSPEVSDTSGAYWRDCRRAEPSEGARDDGAARRLWELSVQLTGVGQA